MHRTSELLSLCAEHTVNRPSIPALYERPSREVERKITRCEDRLDEIHFGFPACHDVGALLRIHFEVADRQLMPLRSFRRVIGDEHLELPSDCNFELLATTHLLYYLGHSCADF